MKVLLVYPEHPTSFWSFDEALRFIDKRSAFPPLGLLTVAGMIPATYQLRLVDMNATPLTDDDLEWADLVVTSSMIIHWRSLETVIARCNARGVPVLNGGPLPSQYYEDIQGDAVFYLGEAENGFVDLMAEMVASPAAAARRYVDRRGRFQSLTRTPLPRWDLIDFDHYSTMLLQITRGCPESCTFCNIPSLYGKDTRLKSSSRVIQELDALYDAGWRGALMAVDDNFVGNQDAITATLEDEVVPWQRERGYPFQINTQASIRVSDNPRLLDAMRQAGFDKVFVGIESPSEASLKFMGAQKNLQGEASLLEKVRVLQRRGFEVQAGFIVGLDTDPDDIAEQMIDFIQTAAIPVAMVGILGVLRDTPDYKRFKRAGRLVESARYTGDSGLLSRELSFVPLIDPNELIDRHRTIVETINSPRRFFERCLRLYDQHELRARSTMSVRAPELRAFCRSVWRQGVKGSYRRDYWRFLANVLLRHPRKFPHAIGLAAQGHHLILTTQEALQVDEMQTFFAEATACLERFVEGHRESFGRGAAYASRLMRAVHDRFRHFQDDERTLRHNAAVLLHAANSYYGTIRERCRQQMRGAMEDFQRDIEHIVEAYEGKRSRVLHSP